MVTAISERRPASVNARAARTEARMASCRCGRRWDSLSQCHCPTCHRQFAGISGFDKHRVAAGRDKFGALKECSNPATARDGKGRRLFVAKREACGTVWREPGRDPRWGVT